MKSIALLGSTGSIGTQALDVARKENIKISALAAGSNVKLLEEQAREFNVPTVALFDQNAAADLRVRLADTPTRVLSGTDGVIETARTEDADIVLNAIVGIAGLKPTMAAIEAKKTLALANKESLVTGGVLVTDAAKKNGVKILPVDSEHSAIFQCLQGVPDGSLRRILLTASGGPFFGCSAKDLESVTVEKALKHPNWSMGRKITIDSATLMNKGFEIIEAAHLFSVGMDDIEVLVHRQSIIHSAIELCDGAVIAQLGTPDMRLPIQYALSYPNRTECAGTRLSLTDIGTLTFQKPDTDVFLCLNICRNAFRNGGLKPAALNGANEAAVALFLDNKIKFTDIPHLISMAVDNQKNVAHFTPEDVFEADKTAREIVLKGALNA